MIQYCCSRKYLISHVFIVLLGCKILSPCVFLMVSLSCCCCCQFCQLVVSLSCCQFSFLMVSLSSSSQFYFSHGFSVFFLASKLFFSWFGCLLVVNFVFSWCWVFCFCQFSFLMALGALYSSNFVLSLWKLWKLQCFNFLCFQPVSTLVLHVVCNRSIPVCCRLSYKNSRALKKSELLLCGVCKCLKTTTPAERQNEKEWNWCKSNSWDLWDGRQISELLDACIALLPLQFSTQSSLPALLLSSHLHSPHSVPLLSNALSNCGHSIQPPHMQQKKKKKKKKRRERERERERERRRPLFSADLL